MKRYLVTQYVQYSKEINADSREEALEIFDTYNADTLVTSERVKLLGPVVACEEHDWEYVSAACKL